MLVQKGNYTEVDRLQGAMDDVNLARDPFYSEYADTITLTEKQKLWMNLKGTGFLSDLRDVVVTSKDLATVL